MTNTELLISLAMSGLRDKKLVRRIRNELVYGEREIRFSIDARWTPAEVNYEERVLELHELIKITLSVMNADDAHQLSERMGVEFFAFMDHVR